MTVQPPFTLAVKKRVDNMGGFKTKLIRELSSSKLLLALAAMTAIVIIFATVMLLLGRPDVGTLALLSIVALLALLGIIECRVQRREHSWQARNLTEALSRIEKLTSRHEWKYIQETEVSRDLSTQHTKRLDQALEQLEHTLEQTKSANSSLDTLHYQRKKDLLQKQITLGAAEQSIELLLARFLRNSSCTHEGESQ